MEEEVVFLDEKVKEKVVEGEVVVGETMARVGGVKLGLNVKGTPVIVRGVRDPKLAFALALIRDGLLLLREFLWRGLEGSSWG